MFGDPEIRAIINPASDSVDIYIFGRVSGPGISSWKVSQEIMTGQWLREFRDELEEPRRASLTIPMHYVPQLVKALLSLQHQPLSDVDVLIEEIQTRLGEIKARVDTVWNQ